MKENIKTMNEYQLTDGMKLLLEEEEIYVRRIKGWFDCGKVETLLETNKFLLTKNHYARSVSNSIILQPVYIPDDTEIVNSIIGPYVSVGNKASIINTIVRNSIIYDGGRTENVLLENSIIGVNAKMIESFKVVNIGDSSIIEPLKLTKKEAL